MLGVGDLDVEAAAQVEAFPGNMAIALDSELARLIVDRRMSSVAFTTEAEGVVVTDLLRGASDHRKKEQ